MPYQYARDDTARRIRITLTDPLTVAERIAAVEQQLADDAWRYATLIDARYLAEYKPKPTEMQAVVARVAEFVAEMVHAGPWPLCRTGRPSSVRARCTTTLAARGTRSKYSGISTRRGHFWTNRPPITPKPRYFFRSARRFASSSVTPVPTYRPRSYGDWGKAA